MREFKTAFVTGATGLLGNNLVRLLVEQGKTVKVVARNLDKAHQQFSHLPVEIIEGDMADVKPFAHALRGCDVLFHTAAFFRDNYKGGKHWDELCKTNIEGTKNLFSAAYAEGVRRAVHVSSIAVLAAPKDALHPIVDETMNRSLVGADDYFRSKILAEEVIRDFVKVNSDMHVTFVLPVWIFGTGDLGPTQAGQLIDDYLAGKVAMLAPGTFSVVDARDVSEAMIRATEVGRHGERYLAAGKNMDMRELCATLAQVTGIPAPKRAVPYPLLYAFAGANELYRAVTGKQVMLSLNAVRILKQEAGKTCFSQKKLNEELGVFFRPVQETVADIVHERRAGF